MNYLKIAFFIAVCLLLMSVTTAMAAQRGLLLLGTSRQSIDGSYEFTSSSFSKTSSREQFMIENYGFGIDYAVLNPEILNGTFNINLLASQNESSSSTSGSRSTSKLGFLYDIKADFFGKSASTLNVFYKSQINDVQRSFGSSYKLNNEIFGANWVIRNNVLPVVFGYSRSVSSTDGTPDDIRYANDEFGLHVSHTLGISRTNLDLTNSINSSESKSGANIGSSRQYRGSLMNSLSWINADRHRSLISSVTVYESATLAANPSSTVDWQESLQWDLGKALKSNFSYNYNNSSTDRGRQQSNAVTGQLQHNLFKSLTTQLQANVRKYNDNFGSESELNGRVSLTYKKMLLAESTLDLGVYQQYGITERTLGQGTLLRRSVLNEAHSVIFGQRTVLVNPNYVVNSILIINAVAAVRPINSPYIEGTDYSVNATSPLAEVIVLPGSQLDSDISTPGGNSLLITYDYLLDSNQRFATIAKGANGSIGFLGGKYRIFAGVDQSSQESLSGGQSSLMNSQSRVTGGVSAKVSNYSLTSQITKYDSTFDNSRSLDSSLDYSDTIRSGTLSLYLRDTYRWYVPDPVKSQSPETVVSIGGNYRIPSIFYGSMAVRADYAKWISTVDSDRVSVGTDFHWTVRKFVISLQSNYAYSRIGGTVSDSESLRLHVTRFF